MVEATFLHGDCLEVLPTLPAGSVDMVFADVPYLTEGYHSTDCHWDKKINLSGLWNGLNFVCKQSSAQIFSSSQPFTADLLLSNRKNYRSSLVWDKGVPGNFMHAKKAVMRFHEDILIFARQQTPYNPQKTARDKPTMAHRSRLSKSGGVRNHKANWTKTYTDYYPSSVLFFSPRQGNRGLHPTQKPVDLLRYLIRTYSNPGDTVLDPTAGSGTTAVAALLEGRNSISIEKDPVIFANAKERVMAVQRSLAPRRAEG